MYLSYLWVSDQKCDIMFSSFPVLIFHILGSVFNSFNSAEIIVAIISFSSWYYSLTFCFIANSKDPIHVLIKIAAPF